MINKDIVTQMLWGYFFPEGYNKLSCPSSTPEPLNQYKPDNGGHLKEAAVQAALRHCLEITQRLLTWFVPKLITSGNAIYTIAHSDFADFAYLAIHTKST